MSAIIRKSVSTLGIPILLLAVCSERTASEAPADAPETTDVVGAIFSPASRKAMYLNGSSTDVRPGWPQPATYAVIP